MNDLRFNKVYVLFCSVIVKKNKPVRSDIEIYIGVGRGGARGGQPPPNNFGGGPTYPLAPPNNPPTFSFNFCVKQEKITNVPS